MSGLVVPASPYLQSRMLYELTGLNLNSAADQTFAPLFGFGRYRIEQVVVTNPSATLAAMTQTLGIFTATGGGGVVIVTAQNLQALVVPDNMIVCTVANPDIRSEVPLYARMSAALGTPGTVDIYIMGTAWS